VEGHRNRSPWISNLWHGFFLFIAFNATVVFGHGPVRGFGLVMCVALVVVWTGSKRWKNGAVL
jgi:hypothetical protein